MASVSVTVGYDLDLKQPRRDVVKGSAVGWWASGKWLVHND